jgi:adenylate kinase family enzyme
MRLADINPGTDYLVVRFFYRDMKVRQTGEWRWDCIIPYAYRATVKAKAVERKYMSAGRWSHELSRNDGIEVEWLTSAEGKPLSPDTVNLSHGQEWLPRDTIVTGLYVICPWDDFVNAYADEQRERQEREERNRQEVEQRQRDERKERARIWEENQRQGILAVLNAYQQHTNIYTNISEEDIAAVVNLLNPEGNPYLKD